MIKFRWKRIAVVAATVVACFYIFLSVAPNSVRIRVTEFRMRAILVEGLKKEKIEKYLSDEGIHYSAYAKGDCRIGPSSGKCKQFAHVDFARPWHPSLMPGQLYVMIFFDDDNTVVGHEMINEFDFL